MNNDYNVPKKILDPNPLSQVRCFPYLQEMLVDSGVGKPDELKWELDIAKAVAVNRICEIRWVVYRSIVLVS